MIPILEGSAKVVTNLVRHVRIAHQHLDNGRYLLWLAMSSDRNEILEYA
jgi:hypothetical protein